MTHFFSTQLLFLPTCVTAGWTIHDRTPTRKSACLWFFFFVTWPWTRSCVQDC
jgi:hypothetical protein